MPKKNNAEGMTLAKPKPSTSQSENTHKAKRERQKVRTERNKAFKAQRTERRRKQIAVRRQLEGWTVVPCAEGYVIERNKDRVLIHLDDEPKVFPTHSAAYEAARSAGQPARLIS